MLQLLSPLPVCAAAVHVSLLLLLGSMHSSSSHPFAPTLHRYLQRQRRRALHATRPARRSRAASPASGWTAQVRPWDVMGSVVLPCSLRSPSLLHAPQLGMFCHPQKLSFGALPLPSVAVEVDKCDFHFAMRWGCCCLSTAPPVRSSAVCLTCHLLFLTPMPGLPSSLQWLPNHLQRAVLQVQGQL